MKILFLPFGIQVNDTVLLGSEMGYLLLVIVNHVAAFAGRPAQEFVAFVQKTDFGEFLRLIILENLVFHGSSDDGVFGVFVELDGILDGFPNGIEIVVRSHLVSRYSVCCAVKGEAVWVKGGVVFRIVLSVDWVVPKAVDRGGIAQYLVFKRAFLAAAFRTVAFPVPAFVDVTFSFSDLVRRRYWLHHVDGQRVGLVVTHGVVPSPLPVAVPHNERVVVLERLQLGAQLVDIDRAVFRDLFSVSVGQVQGVGSARINVDRIPVCIQAVHKFSVHRTPVLQHPISENLVIDGRSGGRFCHHLRFVQIEIGVRFGHGGRIAFIAMIDHLHSVGTIQLVPPLRIQVQFLGNPKTVVFTDGVSIDDHNGVAVEGNPIDGIMNEPPSVHRVCRVIFLDVGGGNSLFV